VKTDSGQQIYIPFQEPENPDIEFIRLAVTAGKVIFVAYDPDSGLCRFAAPFAKDYVETIVLENNQPLTLKVALRLRPSYLYLTSTTPRFVEIRKTLEDSLKNNRLVWVGTFPGGSNILDVYLP